VRNLKNKIGRLISKLAPIILVVGSLVALATLIGYKDYKDPMWVASIIVAAISIPLGLYTIKTTKDDPWW
jgi:magnesium-transporting ATPase (P-type)